MKRTEASIQRNLVKWIKETYPNVKVIAAQNENSRHATEQGTDVGLPDLILMWRVDDILEVFFLELKTKKGRLQPSQKEWAADYAKRFISENTHYDVAYGFSEAKKKIAEVISTPLP